MRTRTVLLWTGSLKFAAIVGREPTETPAGRVFVRENDELKPEFDIGCDLYPAVLPLPMIRTVFEA